MLYSPELAQQGHDNDMSSTSEDNGYPEDIDQDKHDDHTEHSDTERSDAESAEDDFGHHGDSECHNAEKSCLNFRFADMLGNQGRRRT